MPTPNTSPIIDVAPPSPEEIVADLVGGQRRGDAVPPRPRRGRYPDPGGVGGKPTRRSSGAYAEALAKYGQGTEIVIVVTNPVELGVAYFAEAIGREPGDRDRRILGYAAFPPRDRRRAWGCGGSG